jgi:excisionase family DNA binding protein
MKFEDLYKVEEVAVILGLQVETIRKKLRNREMKGIKIGKEWRVKEKELVKFLKEINEEE